MDALLADLQVVCTQLLPILGAVALVFLCIFFRKLAVFLDTVTETVKELNPTLDKVNESIDKVQAPLDTAVRYSHTLDKVHDKAGNLIDRATEFASDRISAVEDRKAEKQTADSQSEQTGKEDL